MGQWNDTDEPLAYLITFRTYGTWLAGDGRGSIDKYHSPWVDKGSRRFLWTDEHVVQASDYVVIGQGGPLPEFD